jgi:translation initiation factor 1
LPNSIGSTSLDGSIDATYSLAIVGKRNKISNPGSDLPVSAPTTSLGSILAGMGFTASETEVPTKTPQIEPIVAPNGSNIVLQSQGKLVLRMERKGRGGKTVTVLSQLRADKDGAEQVARELRRALGCGTRVENSEIVLQGDVRDRARAWLKKHGVKKVVG